MPAKPPPTPDQIAETAYHLWLKAKCPHGRDQEFWFAAESSLAGPAPRKRASAKKPAAKKPMAKAAPAKRSAAKKPATRKAPARKTAKA